MQTSTHSLIHKIAIALTLALALIHPVVAQPPATNGPPRPPLNIKPDPRVEQRSYHFSDTNEEMKYALFVSSKVSKDKKNPLIVALHGLGGDGNSLLRGKSLELAEEGGYILVGPMGYNTSGWYGSPVINMNRDKPIEPANLAELSEKDVLNVLAMMRKEFNVDDDRTYLMGHSMGGAGALYLGSKYVKDWAAIASIAPAAFLMAPTRADILKPIHETHLPVMLIQGGKDEVVPPTATRPWAETMKEMQMDHVYTEIPNGDHGTVINDGMADIFAYFKSHVRPNRK
jgi:predicted esterase